MSNTCKKSVGKAVADELFALGPAEFRSALGEKIKDLLWVGATAGFKEESCRQERELRRTCCAYDGTLKTRGSKRSSLDVQFEFTTGGVSVSVHITGDYDFKVSWNGVVNKKGNCPAGCEDEKIEVTLDWECTFAITISASVAINLGFVNIPTAGGHLKYSVLGTGYETCVLDCALG